MHLTTGQRLKSQVSDAQVIVTKPPKADVLLECAGHAMIDLARDPGAGIEAVAPTPVLIGKRYEDAAHTLQILVTRAGDGPFSLDGAPLQPAEARALPASD